MCGIAGFWRDGGGSAEALGGWAGRMAERLEHRGPDDSGVWVEAAAGLGLSFRRLAIQDLSAAGKQPMVSPCGRFVVVYNGEIYNFRDLARELEDQGARFKGHSDTEVLITAISRWGLEPALERINGMFAFALWDREARSLSLARDRAGKKPLYYGWSGSTLLFGSELKALRAHPDFAAEIDRRALGLFIQYSWIPAPYSIYQGIHKLPAGQVLTIQDGQAPEAARPRPYWSARETLEAGLAAPFEGAYEEAVDELETRLKAAVASRMIADVSLGALLSGGIDSSLVVALMQAQSERPVKTFTIGFHEKKYNEAEHAAAIARHLGTEHTELYITPKDCLDVIPELPSLYDEPFADSSQIPTFLVSKLARQHVTVALSGDGGDELFIGYPGYQRCLERWHQRRGLPTALARKVAPLIEGLAGQISDAGWRPRLAAKLRKRATTLAVDNPIDLYARKRLRCKQEHNFVPETEIPVTLLADSGTWAGLDDPLIGMSFLDFVTYLPDDILVKVDRASMGVSLEVRAPLLDRQVIEFAWRLPRAMKFNSQGGKRVLHSLLSRHVPEALFDRPKAGFSVPVVEWLSGPLRGWAEELLRPGRLRDEGYLNADAVQDAWQRQMSGERIREQLMWNILMFQTWLDRAQPAHSSVPPLQATA